MLALLVIIHLLEAAEGLGDVAGHRRFLSYYESFTHVFKRIFKLRHRVCATYFFIY